MAGHAVNPSLEAHVAPSMALMVPTTHPPRPAHGFKVVLGRALSKAWHSAPHSHLECGSNASSAVSCDTADVPRIALRIVQAAGATLDAAAMN